mgnify:FL=1
MKKNCLTMILIMCSALVIPVIAEQENFILGTYKVSFDLGIEDLRNWVVDGPKNSESMDGSYFTAYSVHEAPITESQFYSELKRLGRAPSADAVSISIYQYNSTDDLSMNGTATKVEALLKEKIGCTINKRTIDGRRGTIGSQIKDDHTTYVADWWVENNTSAFVVSTYPWDEGTLSLLKTIHIEKIS